MDSEDIESSDDEFFDAEDNSEINLNHFEIGCKLVEGLDISKLLQSEGLQFELSEVDKPLDEENGNLSGNSTNIFRNPITGKEKTEKGHANKNLSLDIDVSYDEIEAKMEPIISCGGIKKLVLQHGLGSQAHLGDIVQVKLMVFMEGVDEPIDDMYAFNKSFRFKIGSGVVITVVDFAVLTMAVGETSKFLAKPEFAYGPLGIPPNIPADTRAMVTIQLIKIIDCKNINIGNMGSSRRTKMSFETLHESALNFKKQGSVNFENQKYFKAIRRYKTAINIMHDTTPGSGTQQFQTKWELLCILHTNCAQCHIMLKQFNEATIQCKLAIELTWIPEIKKAKAYYRYAKALFAKGEFLEAKEVIEKCGASQVLGLYDSDVHQLYHQISSKIQQDNDSAKDLARKMFSK